MDEASAEPPPTLDAASFPPPLLLAAVIGCMRPRWGKEGWGKAVRAAGWGEGACGGQTSYLPSGAYGRVSNGY